jgi:hypothetical protein
MRPTAYFSNASDMAKHAISWRDSNAYRWYLRTTLRCDHVHHEKRKAIVLIERERVVQKLITCKSCCKREPSPDREMLATPLTLKSFLHGH